MGKKKERVKQMFQDKAFDEREAKSYSKRYAAVVLSVISAVTCVLSIVGYLLLKQFNDTNVLREWCAEHPVWGAACMIAICMIQVVIALIPGEVVEVAAGYVFGIWWGTLLCLVGMALGSVIAILLARRFGKGLVEALYSREKMESLPILNDPKKRNAMTAILFLIPGTPKDLLTYLIGLTEMSIPLYLLITLVCRIPSVIMSTISGSALGDDRIKRAVILFVITGVISACGYFLYLWIQKRSKKKHLLSKDKPSRENDK